MRAVRPMGVVKVELMSEETPEVHLRAIDAW